jgi:hypothetical protein
MKKRKTKRFTAVCMKNTVFEEAMICRITEIRSLFSEQKIWIVDSSETYVPTTLHHVTSHNTVL